jgi:hypothetical protein
MTSHTTPSLVEVVKRLLRRQPDCGQLEALIGVPLLRAGGSSKDHVAFFTIAEAGGNVRCTIGVKGHAAGKRLMVHFKLDSTIPMERWHDLVSGLGPPEPAIDPPPLVSPGAAKPRAYYKWIYRVGESVTLTLVRDFETNHVADVYVFWALP